jgi:hypothetical protein
VKDTLTTWTLWRGDDLLGALFDRSIPHSPNPMGDDVRHVNAVLVPDPARLPLPSLRQVVAPPWAGSTVMEYVQETRVASHRPREATRSSSGPAIGVWEVPPGPGSLPPGVPPERQLVVRNEAGRIVPTRSVGILEYRPDPAHLPLELDTFPSGAFVGGSLWLVDFTQVKVS